MSELVEKYTPVQIAQLIRKIDPTFHDPTPEQAEIISILTNPLEPSVVIAGAGSGKTETMAARVVYLVANKIVKPDEILGLTFTRKAAGELSLRIRKRLRQLQAAEPSLGITSLDTAVTTYHSYAGRLLSEHSIRYGIDADAQPLGDAAMWQMANSIVRNWGDESFTNESAVSTVVGDLLGLTKLILEHQISPSEIERVDNALLEKVATFTGAENDGVRRVKRTASQRIALLPMVEHFIRKRRESGELSFDDQMSLAAQIAEKFPDVCQQERSKYRVVLLDEYQDTSQSQVRMLSALFGQGHPVTAVGDPCQSIYTWRGASAGTIGSFTGFFPKSVGARGKSIYPLPTTFRNDLSILTLANQISEDIRRVGALDVAPLKAREGAGAGDLVCGIFESMEAEAQAIAEYFDPLWKDKGESESFAVLVRKRSQIAPIQSALRARDIPVEVIGLGGLIHVPEVADIVAILRVINDPDAGASLMRHLVGPRLNIGPKDLAALGAYSRKRAEDSHSDSKTFISKIAAGNPERSESDDLLLGSLIGSLDEIDKAEKSAFTPEGFNRLSEFARDLRGLRSRAGGSITDLIYEIERYLNIEVEAMVREGTGTARRNIDRFMDEAAKFARTDSSLSALLQWLDVAGEQEGGLKSGAPDVRSDVVQILTVHMSKGAEWDVVAIPGLADGTFPGVNTSDPDNWITNEKHIPFPLRGDASELPVFSWGAVEKNSDAKKVIDEYGRTCNAFREREEIRLGYVAVTRAKKRLLCTTSWWRDGSRYVEPSEIFLKVLEVARVSGRVISEIGAPESGIKNPQIENPRTGIWPRDFLGAARESFESAAALVRSAEPADLGQIQVGFESWFEAARAVTAEVHNMRSATSDVALPTRLSTSTLVNLHKDPSELALTIRRPMPHVLDEYSRRGTIFHQWIESYFDSATLFDDEDLDPLDPIEGDTTLAALQEKWLSSKWADKKPYKVEVPFETVIAGVLVRGRIDAVYKNGDLFEVVDWKTGSSKLGASAAIQLAVYRLAWATLAGVDISRVTAAFHYVPTGIDDRPADLMDLAALEKLIEDNSKR